MIATINDKDDSEFPLCEEHLERYKHFACAQDNKLYCRACIELKLVKCDHHLVDLYLLKPELVNAILYKISKSLYNGTNTNGSNEEL